MRLILLQIYVKLFQEMVSEWEMKSEMMAILMMEMAVQQQPILLKMDGYEMEDPLLHLINVNCEHQATIQTIIKIVDKVDAEMASKCLKNNEMTMTLVQVMVAV